MKDVNLTKQRAAQLVKRPETAKTALFAAAVIALVFVFIGRGQSEDTLQTFLSQLDVADSIHYCPPGIYAKIYPSIEEEDLLARAKECLSTFTYLSDDDPQPDLSPRAAIYGHRVILNLDSGQMEYSLLWQNDCTYLLPGNLIHELAVQEAEVDDQLQDASGTCISKSGDNIPDILANLADGRRYVPDG